jgi:hypothetical protein
MTPRLHSGLKLLQPIGFILFALYFLRSGDTQQVNILFILALTVTSCGIAYETWHGIVNRHKNPAFRTFIFYGNALLKVALLASIALKIASNNHTWAIYTLAVVVILAVVWNVFVIFRRKGRKKAHHELLDDLN